MLSKSNNEGRFQVSVHSLDELVPKHHLVRKIENAIDFSFIYDLVRDKY
ncbi:IS5/IS1182 family transposase, partial [Paenibacillus sp. N10]|nr:IS5/IS1182 family transposase [Paenibacillus lutrae]